MFLYITLSLSLLINGLLVWYVSRLLRKFLYISDNMADTMLTVKAFRVFVKSMYSMDSYRGEPMIEELIMRIQEVHAQLDVFRDIFQYSLDEELEEELNAAEEEAQKIN